MRPLLRVHLALGVTAKLGSVQTSIMGKSDQAVIAALIASRTDPEHLLCLVRRGVKAPPEKIVAALTGRITDRHRFLPRPHLRQARKAA